MVWLPLAGKLQKTQNENPQRGHEMPIPGGHIQGNCARLRRWPQKHGCSGRQQRKNTAEQVHSVRPSQKIKERTVGAGGYVEAACLQLAPDRPLSLQKTKAQHHGEREPKNCSFATCEDIEIGSGTRRCGEACNLAASQLTRTAVNHK